MTSLIKYCMPPKIKIKIHPHILTLTFSILVAKRILPWKWVMTVIFPALNVFGVLFLALDVPSIQVNYNFFNLHLPLRFGSLPKFFIMCDVFRPTWTTCMTFFHKNIKSPTSVVFSNLASFPNRKSDLCKFTFGGKTIVFLGQVGKEGTIWYFCAMRVPCVAHVGRKTLQIMEKFGWETKSKW